MSDAMQGVKELLEELLEAQEKTNLYTFTLERDRLFAALIQAGVGMPWMFDTEFSLVAGANATVIQVVPAGFVWLFFGPWEWHTSVPWWCRYRMWQDTVTPAVPNWDCVRMPAHLSQPDFGGVWPVRQFIAHRVDNAHIADTAYSVVQNAFLVITDETWHVVRGTFLDPIVDDLRDRARKMTGMTRW